MISNRLKGMYIFFTLIIATLVTALLVNATKYAALTKDCKGEFELPKNAYWHSDCMWLCKDGWHKDAETASCILKTKK